MSYGIYPTIYPSPINKILAHVIAIRGPNVARSPSGGEDYGKPNGRASKHLILYYWVRVWQIKIHRSPLPRFCTSLSIPICFYVGCGAAGAKWLHREDFVTSMCPRSVRMPLGPLPQTEALYIIQKDLNNQAINQVQSRLRCGGFIIHVVAAKVSTFLPYPRIFYVTSLCATKSYQLSCLPFD